MQIPDDETFYEIEYDTYPVKGVGKFVLKSQKIEPVKKDEIRELFYNMRDISRNYRPDFGYNRFFDRGINQVTGTIFYKQGIFMKDFTDDYSEKVEFSSYFPTYQMMSYEQLRTYFTWRTKLREGNIEATCLSYAFLYIYELLNNIGVDNAQDGLDKLMHFWTIFSEFNKSIDKYVLRWLKDYHIYYNLPQTFKEFAQSNNLLQYYPKIADTYNDFDLFCSVSKYDIRKSAFFKEENKKLIADCWDFVAKRLREVLVKIGIDFDNSIFSPTKKMIGWQPFKDAVFHSWQRKPDRRVVISQFEIYICHKDKWEWSNVITSDSGRGLVGYIIKQMESELRKLTKFKFKLTANINLCPHPILDKLKKQGMSIEQIINSAVSDFYRELTKVVIEVDNAALSKIRQEALLTQEKLMVEEPEIPTTIIPIMPEITEKTVDSTPAFEIAEAAKGSDIWTGFKNSLKKTEIEAIKIIISDNMAIKRFADDNSIMLEVLIGDINEKAMDFIGDNIIDDELLIYEDYMEEISTKVVTQ